MWLCITAASVLLKNKDVILTSYLKHYQTSGRNVDTYYLLVIMNICSQKVTISKYQFDMSCRFQGPKFMIILHINPSDLSQVEVWIQSIKEMQWYLMVVYSTALHFPALAVDGCSNDFCVSVIYYCYPYNCYCDMC